MLDLLEETVKKRDYKLVFIWGCTGIQQGFNCNASVSLMVHRTQQEYDEGLRNIKQVCTNGHITRPYKKCNKCDSVYPQEETICNKCESRAKELAGYEMEIALANKRLKKLQKIYRNNKQDPKYQEEKKTLEQIIILAKENLKA